MGTCECDDMITCQRQPQALTFKVLTVFERKTSYQTAVDGVTGSKPASTRESIILLGHRSLLI